MIINSNNQERKSIKEEVLEKIKSGQVKMKPKIFFVLRTILILGGVFVVSGLIIFLISFINFHLRASGIWYLPAFGFRGLGVYLRLLPWLLIFISLILILVLETLAKKFSFVWRRPIFYSLLVIIFIALAGGFLIEKTAFHPQLFLKAAEGKLPLVAPIYQEFGMPKLQDIHRGLVDEVNENEFKIRTLDEESLTVILTRETRFPSGKEIKEGDSVVIMGKKDDSTIRAFGVRKIKDQFRNFERRRLRPPMKWKK